MSPLACSLFALASLFASAQSNCSTRFVLQQYGVTEVNYQPLYFMPAGITVDASTNYCPPPYRVVGEYITACNLDPNGPAPHIDAPAPGPFSPYTVRCNYLECPQGAQTTLKQYCN